MAIDYTVELSDTAVTMHLRGGKSLAMSFPRSLAERDSNRIIYHHVFSGIDLVVYGKGREIEYDWIVAPGADVGAVQVSFSGAQDVSVDRSGDLVIDTAAGEVRQTAPVLYQVGRRGRQPVNGRFELRADGQVGFAVGAYDRTRELVIDPSIAYSVGFGGTGYSSCCGPTGLTISFADTATSMGRDRFGNFYFAGTTFSADFPLINPVQKLPQGASNPGYCSTFVAKVSADGTTLLYSTYIDPPPLAGCYLDMPSQLGLAVDPDGNAYLAASTSAFPQAAHVTKLDPNGNLVGSLLFRGSGSATANSVVLGPDGYLYVAGTASSKDFPATGVYSGSPFPPENIFLMKLDPAKITGNQTVSGAVVYSTFVGRGTPIGLAVDSSGVYIAANVVSPGWGNLDPATLQPACGSSCALLVKVTPGGDKLIYSTYLGGIGSPTLTSIAIDNQGQAIVAGTTNAVLATTPGALKSNPSTAYLTPFVARLTADARSFVYQTYLDMPSKVLGISVDNAGNAYLAGLGAASGEYVISGGAIAQMIYTEMLSPTPNGFQIGSRSDICELRSESYTFNGWASCYNSGFLAELNPLGTGLVWASYMGSGSVNAISLDSGGVVYVTGSHAALMAAPIGGSPSAAVSLVKIVPETSRLQFNGPVVRNAASSAPGLPTPGGLASIPVSGLDLAGSISADSFPLPYELAGVTVFVDQRPVPLLSIVKTISGQQINFQMPFETASNYLEIQYKGISTYAWPLTTAPGIFLLADGTPAIQHASDYSMVTPANPAAPGEDIIVWATGLGTLSAPATTGMPASEPDPVKYAALLQISRSIGAITYAGLAPGYVGLYQVNIKLSPTLASGTANLALDASATGSFFSPADLISSNSVAIPVQ